MSLDPPLFGQTPIDDLSGLRIKGIATQRELNEHEAENIRKAMLKYMSARPSRRLARFDHDWLLQLHAEMFSDVWDWAGKLRRRELNIGSEPSRIGEDLHTLLEDLKVWRRSSMDLIEQGAILHHRAVRIHPFMNGNGRWARLLTNIWLKQNDGQAIIWPEATVGSASIVRNEYIAALKAADEHDLAPLVSLHRTHAETRD